MGTCLKVKLYLKGEVISVQVKCRFSGIVIPVRTSRFGYGRYTVLRNGFLSIKIVCTNAYRLIYNKLPLKVNSQQAKAEGNAKISFDDCHLFSDVFYLFCCLFRTV